MSWTIFSVTAGGAQIGRTLAGALSDAHHFTLPGKGEDTDELITPSLKDHVASVFHQSEVIVFVMASGIAVRTIAALIADKTTDPAVLVIDEKGRFVISLLSGHLGGANRAAEEAARILNAVPVITTATDANGMLAPDMLARRFNAVIDDMAACKTIAALMLDGASIALYTDEAVTLPFPYVAPEREHAGAVYCTNRISVTRTEPSLLIIPRTIILGVGCRRGTDPQALKTFVADELAILGIDQRAVCAVASIDIKKDEEAILATAESLNVQTYFYSADELRTVEEKFECSAFVRETTGVGAVAEASAYLAAGDRGKILLPKKIKDGMTLAIAEKQLPEEQ